VSHRFSAPVCANYGNFCKEKPLKRTEWQFQSQLEPFCQLEKEAGFQEPHTSGAERPKHASFSVMILFR
jgi:hypothetical protein